MKKRILFLTLIVSSIFGLTWLSRVYAQDADANKGEAQKAETRLEAKFNVTDARIDSLRKQGLGYGEINHVLSLAKQMPGGINDQNINKIMTLRQGTGGHKEGWGEIAHNLNLKLGSEERAEAQTRVPSRGSEERLETRASEGSEGFHENEGFHGAAAGIGHR